MHRVIMAHNICIMNFNVDMVRFIVSHEISTSNHNTVWESYLKHDEIIHILQLHP